MFKPNQRHCHSFYCFVFCVLSQQEETTDNSQEQNGSGDMTACNCTEPRHSRDVTAADSRAEDAEFRDDEAQRRDTPKRPAQLDLLSVPTASTLNVDDDDMDECEKQTSGTVGWAAVRSTVKVAGVMKQQRKRNRKTSGGVQRQDSFLKKFSTRYGVSSNIQPDADNSQKNSPSTKTRKSPNSPHFEQIEQPKPAVINPDGNFMFYWLGIVTIAVLYNLWSCIAREGFPDLRKGFDVYWFVSDGIFDFVYFADIIIQLRTGYLERGLVVYSSQKLALHYTRSKFFIIDILSLLPLDILQFFIGIHPLVRFPRFLKAYRAYRFSYMVETRTVYPNMWRVANLSHVLFLGSHWFAAFYYMISEAEDFRSVWGYPKPVGEFASVTRKYLKCLYWSTLTLTTIGDLPPPDSNWE